MENPATLTAASLKIDANALPAKEAAPSPVATQPTKNGITRPKPDSLTGQVWTVCDKVAAMKSVKPEVFKAEVVKRYVADGGSKGTAGVQIGRWKKFHA